MVQRTTADEQYSRKEVERYLTTLAREFGNSEPQINVPVGNKTVELSPPDNVSLSVDVVERSSKLRGSHEKFSLELSWKPQSK